MLYSSAVIGLLIISSLYTVEGQVGKVQACGSALHRWLVQACAAQLRSWNLTTHRPYYEGFFDRGEGPTLVAMCCRRRCDYPVLSGYQKCELLIPHGVNVG